VRNNTREHAQISKGGDPLEPPRRAQALAHQSSNWPALGLVRYSFPVAHAGHLHTIDVIWERTPVAAVCDVCGKRPGFGHNVPWSKKKTNRRWDPNIQRVRAIVSGSPKRLNVCTSCIKAGKVTR
jgi:large subunit ribosomal protein L28